MIELLVDQTLRVFCVNCKVKGPDLHIGAIYLGPNLLSDYIRFPYKGGMLELQVPPELGYATSPSVAWEVQFPFTYHPA